MDYRGVLVPAAVGTVVALALAPFTLPVLSLGAAALATALLVRVLDAQRYYSMTGTVLYLTVGGILPAIAVLPEFYDGKTRFLLLTIGPTSGLLVTARETVGYVVSLVESWVSDNETVSRIFHALTTLFSAGYIVYQVYKGKRKAIRSVLLGIAVPTSVTVNVLGNTIEFGTATDAVAAFALAAFLAVVMATFHTLESIHHLLQLRDDPVVEAAGEKTKATAKRAAETGKEVAGTASDAGTDVADTADSAAGGFSKLADDSAGTDRRN